MFSAFGTISMTLLWHESFGSFFDALTSDQGGAPANVDTGTPWFAPADGGLSPGESLLWWENGSAPPTGSPDLWHGGPLWPEGGGSTPGLTGISPITGVGAGQAMTAPSSPPTGEGMPNPWQQLLSGITSLGSANWFQDLTWTGPGGSNPPPLTQPITGLLGAGAPQLGGDTPVASASPHLTGIRYDDSGNPILLAQHQ